MKRILFLVPSLDGGGAERATLDLASGLDKARFDVIVVTEKVTVGAAYSVADHVRVVSLEAPSTKAALRPLRQFIKHEKPSVLYSALPHLNALAVLATRAWRQRPLVITSVHNNLSREFRTLRGGHLWRWLTPWTYRNSHRIVCVSNGVATDAIEHFGAPPQRIRVIPNPIDISSIKVAAQESVDLPWSGSSRPNSLVLVAAGRLVEQKNYPMLLNVTKRLVDEGVNVSTTILGEGPLKRQLLKLAHSLGIENRVHFAGRVQNPYAVMRQADIFMLTSDYEGFGMVLVEAMAAGVPVISTDCDFGPHDILGGGQFGVLTPVGSVSAMSSAVSSLSSNCTRMQELRELGLARAMEYSTRTVCSQFEALLNEALC